MRRFADIFVALCIPVVAVSTGVVAYQQFDAGMRFSAAVAAATLAVLTVVRLNGLARRRIRDLEAKIVGLAKRFAEIDGDILAIDRRLALIEDGGSRRSRAELEQLVAEVEVIGTLTRQVIETVADLEMSVAESRSQPTHDARAAAAAPSAAPAPARTAKASTSPLVPDRFGHLEADGFLATVRAAVEADRIDLHLQPIVTLPQRKVRFYECLTRLRTEDGETIHPSDYIPLAEARGFVAAIDQQILMKSVLILRRLAARSKEVGIFLNLSTASLGDGMFFGEFVKVLEANRDLTEMLVLEFPHAAVRAMGPLETEGLKTLGRLGFRFSIDQVTDLKISFQNLADLGFRFVKISADRLLSRAGDLGTDIHPVDLADYFQRFGLDLIADQIEREADVVDVLDFGVRYGQGFLFSPPRPVRADVLQAAAAEAKARPPIAAPTEPAPAKPAEARAAGGDRPAGARPLPTPPGRAARAPAATAAAAAAKPAPAPAPEPPRPGIRIVPGTGPR